MCDGILAEHARYWRKGGGNRPCRDGAACTAPSCKFDHPPGRIVPPSPAVGSGGKGGGGKGGGNRPCRDGAACTAPSCKFDHPPGRTVPPSPAVGSGGKGGGGKGGGNRPYRDGAACTAPSCKFDHPPKQAANASSAADADNELRSSASLLSGVLTCRDDLSCLNPSCDSNHSAQRPKFAARVMRALIERALTSILGCLPRARLRVWPKFVT